MNTTYKTVVSAAQRAARDIARARWIMNLTDTLNGFKKKMEGHEKTEAAIEKKLAVAKFEADRAVEQNDPRAEDLKEHLEVATKTYEYEMKNLENVRSFCQKAIDSVLEEITKVESGELKVCKETMNERAKDLIGQRYGKDFLDGAYDVETTDEQS